MVKVPIWAYYCMNSYVTTRARSTRVLQYCHFDNHLVAKMAVQESEMWHLVK